MLCWKSSEGEKLAVGAQLSTQGLVPGSLGVGLRLKVPRSRSEATTPGNPSRWLNGLDVDPGCCSRAAELFIMPFVPRTQNLANWNEFDAGLRGALSLSCLSTFAVAPSLRLAWSRDGSPDPQRRTQSGN